MVAGTPPIRAKKARYFEDAQFQARILAPPVSKMSETKRADDWTARPLPSRPKIEVQVSHAEQDGDGETQHEQRKQAELNQANAPDQVKPPDNEFEPDLKRPSSDRAAQLRLFDQQARQAAQRAALDPDDGIEL